MASLGSRQKQFSLLLFFLVFVLLKRKKWKEGNRFSSKRESRQPSQTISVHWLGFWLVIDHVKKVFEPIQELLWRTEWVIHVWLIQPTDEEVPVWWWQVTLGHKIVKLHFAWTIRTNIFELDCLTRRQSCEIQKQAWIVVVRQMRFLWINPEWEKIKTSRENS